MTVHPEYLKHQYLYVAKQHKARLTIVNVQKANAIYHHEGWHLTSKKRRGA